jgi:acyl dehydratase
MMGGAYTVREMRTRLGSELGVSDWMLVEQPMIDEFAHSTKDLDQLHVNPAWAARETPYGGTIAFGFWTLSMLTHFSHEVGMWPVDVAYALNYGLDRVRWIHPVKVGSRIRMRCTLAELAERDDGRLLIRTNNLIEIEGESRPALTAEWLGLFILEGGTSGDAATDGRPTATGSPAGT